MKTIDKIYALESKIVKAETEMLKIKKEAATKVKVGDYVILLKDIEWGPGCYTKMYVDGVADGRIYCRDQDPAKRAGSIYWVSNGDYVIVD